MAELLPEDETLLDALERAESVQKNIQKTRDISTQQISTVEQETDWLLDNPKNEVWKVAISSDLYFGVCLIVLYGCTANEKSISIGEGRSDWI